MLRFYDWSPGQDRPDSFENNGVLGQGLNPPPWTSSQLFGKKNHLARFWDCNMAIFVEHTWYCVDQALLIYLRFE